AKLGRRRREVLVCGDWNIGHTELDIKNWKGNVKNSGFLPEERAWMSEYIGEGRAFKDVVRELHPGEPGPYAWWSWRGKAFDNDSGWRIDP
ncbi:endonuclease/exonuclease/phosphatase family protein, partial [Mycobacterium kansasii]